MAFGQSFLVPEGENGAMADRQQAELLAQLLNDTAKMHVELAEFKTTYAENMDAFFLLTMAVVIYSKGRFSVRDPDLFSDAVGIRVSRGRIGAEQECDQYVVEELLGLL
jgi:hypothetical protein